MGLGEIALLYCLGMGALLVVAGYCIKIGGGSFGSANTRRRMKEWGSDIEEKRLEDLGFGSKKGE